VRPLNVTNTDNRLLASATRLAIEPTLSTLITEDQRGFIGGRSMIANLVDVDEAVLEYALASNDAIALFYDFAAAFPSVEHRMLHVYFAALGWPDWLLRMVLNLYHNIVCNISMGKSVYVGFGNTRGIRQGCPLSPLLFAAVSELLLRRLRRMFLQTVNRAWADDLAMVLRRGLEQLGAIQNLFQGFTH